MLKGKHGMSSKGYTTKGEGGKQFSMAEGHPKKIRLSHGDVKNAQAGQNAATQMGAQNIAPDFEEAARIAAAED